MFSDFAGQNGGAVAMVSTGSKENTSTIWSSSFKDNKATFSGGAVYVTGGVVDVVKSNFTANKAGMSINMSNHKAPYTIAFHAHSLLQYPF